MLNGIVNINKEAGYTSHDVVAKLRGITKQRKIGHTGTLDPDAKGVLPICFGKATKVCDLLTNKDKVYVTTLLLGKSSDTQDSSGEILSEQPTCHLTEEQVEDCIKSFVGESDQIPPMYSALKVDGKKLYELAREGKEIPRKPRKIIIDQINILEINLPRVTMEIKCSKGTYIRTICHDIGENLGCGGLMEDLWRTKVADFTLEDSLTIDEFRERFLSGQIDDIMVKIETILEEYPRFVLKEGWESLAYNGALLPSKLFSETVKLQKGEKARVYDCFQNFIGVYQWIDSGNGDGKFKVEKMFFQ
jgi:tRNA pseudouridine55 synthase